MNNYAVVFDMDGVIAHTNPYHAIAFQKFFDKYGAPHSQEEFENHMYGKFNDYIMRYFFRDFNFSDERLVELADEKEAMFREIYAEHAAPIPRFLEFLTELKLAGFKTGVATSAPRKNLELIMGMLGFESQMESKLSSESVTHHKPDPEVYLKSMENLGSTPEKTIVFEDSASGIQAGLNAGAKVVGVLTTHTQEQLPKCDFYIYDYNDISAEKVKELLGILYK